MIYLLLIFYQEINLLLWLKLVKIGNDHLICYEILIKNWYKVIPVNPSTARQEISAELCYSSPEGIPMQIDMINIFGPSEFYPSKTKEAIKVGIKTIWMQ